MHQKFYLFLLLLALQVPFLKAQHSLMQLIPVNTATHTAQQSGDWFDPATWAEGTIPQDAAIVYIPAGITISYEGNSTAHLFAIRVDGTFTCTQATSSDTTRLTFDTFVGTMNSKIQFHAANASDGNIWVSIQAFDIEAHKTGSSGYSQTWNTAAQDHFSDREVHYQLSYDIGPDNRFKSYDLALLGNTSVTETSRTAVDDLAGVLGRTGWDSTQLSIGLVTMGEIEVFGQEKTTMVKLSADAPKAATTISLESPPTGWSVGDSILLTPGGNINATANAPEVVEIMAISGTSITCSKLKKNHLGRPADDLHCSVGNLHRNIVFQSVSTDSTHRGHLMAMHNDSNVQIKNALFKNMGRTSKSKLTDDRIWSEWKEPVVKNPYVSALGQECSQLVAPPSEDISNHRGRYSIHLHQLGAALSNKRAEVTGNVIWGNPGWGITHHSSHANISENVVYDVVGSGIVSEAGDETGFWDNNLVVQIDKGHTFDVYEASLFYDDYLFSGQGLGMKGRGVVCRGNVIADANMGIGVVNFNAAVNSTTRMDAAALASVRPGFQFDQFPLNSNGYAIEGDGILPVEVALIMENTTVISCVLGLSSIERDMGVNHKSRSVFHNLKVWGAVTGVRITYQNDYSFRDLFVSGKNDNSIGLYMWKHAHNHSFERIKLVDLKEGITASKLVENSSYTTQKTRNNGFTPWLFIDLETENVTDLYGIHLDDESSPTSYTEHPDNAIHLSSDQLSMTRPITFTLNESADLEIDLGSSPVDLQFKVDGVVSDRIGAYEFGIEQASSMQNLRNDYPERIYEFASQSKLEDYLSANGLYEDPEDGTLYFIINEYVPDRISYEYKAFPIRVKILNPPTGGVYDSPTTEAPQNLEPQNELISRAATATQSSTSTSELFNGTSINTPASRAIDGNSNARINARYYQFGLDSIGSSAITATELEPWWEMDLGEEKIIEYMDLWNTVDLQGTALETPASHFKDFYVLIDDQPFGAIDLATARANANFEYYQDATVTRVLSLGPLNTTGRYIRIQAVGNTKIGLAEIDVIGRSISTEADCNGVVGGLAYFDECDDCVAGNTGLSPCALDANYVWGDTATVSTLTSSVLPVELIRFTGQLIHDRTRLDWASASEANLSAYELQRSRNGRDWEQFAFVEAKNRPANYREWDNYPYEKLTYYRLKVIHQDGTYEYSKVIVVQGEKASLVWLYPNPSANRIHIEYEAANNQSIHLVVLDILGSVVYQQAIYSLSEQHAPIVLDLAELHPGTYYLQSTIGGHRKVIPFVMARE